jgi:hypothetical protein
MIVVILRLLVGLGTETQADVRGDQARSDEDILSIAIYKWIALRRQRSFPIVRVLSSGGDSWNIRDNRRVSACALVAMIVPSCHEQLAQFRSPCGIFCILKWQVTSPIVADNRKTRTSRGKPRTTPTQKIQHLMSICTQMY